MVPWVIRRGPTPDGDWIEYLKGHFRYAPITDDQRKEGKTDTAQA